MDLRVAFIFGVVLTTAVSNDLDRLSASTSQFTRTLYQKIVEGNADRNVIISPLSVHTALSMLYQGSASTTQQHLATVLALPDKNATAFSYNRLTDSINNVPEVTLKIANKLFVNTSYEVRRSFEDVLTNYFLAKPEKVNFVDGDLSTKTVNDWVESSTNHKIKDLVKREDFTPVPVVLLVNAIYFKGSWVTAFNEGETRSWNFRVSDKVTAPCQMMSVAADFNYTLNSELGAQIIELPFRGHRVSMYIILPLNTQGLVDVENRLINSEWSDVIKNLSPEQVTLLLPKFKVETTVDLKNPLTKIGLGELFTNPDLTELGPGDLVVSKALQKAFIEVNEEGAEASAATVVFVVDRSDDGQNHQFFVVDHPFVVALVDNEENVPLFVGHVANPAETSVTSI